jgi:superfamily II DNA or RNA helicase
VPKILDNLGDDTRLVTALRDTFGHYGTLDVATGYLDLRGWGHLADLVDTKPVPSGRPVVRVLVGMVAPSDSEQLLTSLQQQVRPPEYGSDIPDASKARQRRDQLVRHLRNQLMRGLATRKGQETLRTLRRQIAEGRVELRVFTPRPLHGKTYLFHGAGGGPATRWGYVGSSNLTGAGLTSNLELNVDVADGDANTKLADWFEDLWNDKFSLPITQEVMELVDDSWAAEEQPSPFEVYLKVCHALAQDARDGMGYVLPESLQKRLLDYQASAVRTLARRIVRRGGTMLGDVVGLGKTLTAIATAAMLQAGEDYRTLVLCPKNLVGMWQDHIDAYEIDGQVIPYSMVAKLLPEQTRRYHLVICDESHNLRNESTQVYSAIEEYIDVNDSKVLLLTATPYNLAFSDVAGQIGLYLDDDTDLGIAPTKALEKDPDLPRKVDGKVTTLAAFRHSNEPEDWRRLMSEHLIRRTRSFIKRTARTRTVIGPDGRPVLREYLKLANGQEFAFPTRIAKPLTHEFGEDDPARLMEDEQTLDAVRDLRLPRYRLADYENKAAPHTPEDTRILEDIASGRGHVSGFVRIGLFKRLSSSGHSFILSLQKQRARNELFLYAIENGLPLPVGAFTETQFRVGDSDPDEAGTAELHGSVASRYEALRASAGPKVRWVNSTVFTHRLADDLQADNSAIQAMLDRFGTWDSARDSKLNRLVDLLRADHPGEKVLVFTEYADTAEYVARALREAGIERVGLATGSTDADLASIARRFSPRSNRRPGQPEPVVEDPIDVLVATDVLSEGQNLQDAHIVVNYDLPWAIIRLIQRAGRVDRIGQASDTVYLYLITHDTIEAQIGLRRRIKQRLSDAAAAFGSDESFFGEEKEIQLLGDFYDGKLTEEDAAEGEGDADAVSEAWLAWSQAKEQFPDIAERAVSLPDLTHTTRFAHLGERDGSVTTYVRTESGIDAFAQALVRDDGTVETRLLTPREALGVFHAEPSTPTAPEREDHFDLEEALLHGPLHEEVVTAGNLHGIRRWVWHQLGGTAFGAKAEPGLSALYERPLTEHAKTRLSAARRNRYSLDDLADLVRRLHEDDRLVVGSGQDDDVKVVCSIGVRAS